MSWGCGWWRHPRIAGDRCPLFGSKVPAAELCVLAAATQPDVIGLSFTLPELGPLLEHQVAALQEVCPDARILVGGQGIPPGLAARSGATFVRDVEELVSMASRWPVREPALDRA